MQIHSCQVDVLVAGGGPAVLSAARRLGRARRSVLVEDSRVVGVEPAVHVPVGAAINADLVTEDTARAPVGA